MPTAGPAVAQCTEAATVSVAADKASCAAVDMAGLSIAKGAAGCKAVRTVADKTVAACKHVPARKFVNMFAAERTKQLRLDNGLKGFHDSPHPITALGMLPDYELHVSKLRGFGGKHAIMLYIEMGLLLNNLVMEQKSWAGGVPPEWQFPEASTGGNSNPRSYFAATLKGALNMVPDNKKKLGFKFSQPDGRAIVRALRLEHSVVPGLPPALALPTQHLEVHWRVVISMLAVMDPAQMFGHASLSAAADALEASLKEIAFWARRLFPLVETVNAHGQKFVSSYFSPSMHVLMEHAVRDMRSLPPGESLASYSTAIFEMMHILTRMQNLEHTGGRANLKFAPDVWTGLVRSSALFRWSKLKTNPALLEQHAQAAAKRAKERRPQMVNFAHCAKLAKEQRERCCEGSKLGSALSIDPADGSCTLELLETPCASRAVCDWAIGADACASWTEGGPPTAGLRCAKAAKLDGDGDGAEGDEYGDDADVVADPDGADADAKLQAAATELVRADAAEEALMAAATEAMAQATRPGQVPGRTQGKGSPGQGNRETMSAAEIEALTVRAGEFELEVDAGAGGNDAYPDYFGMATDEQVTAEAEAMLEYDDPQEIVLDAMLAPAAAPAARAAASPPLLDPTLLLDPALLVYPDGAGAGADVGGGEEGAPPRRSERGK